MDADTIRCSAAGRLYQVVEWRQTWKLGADGQWYRQALVYADGRLELWLVPDDTRD